MARRRRLCGGRDEDPVDEVLSAVGRLSANDPAQLGLDALVRPELVLADQAEGALHAVSELDEAKLFRRTYLAFN